MNQRGKEKQRIYTISDSTAAVLILAECLPLLPDYLRKDLHLREALSMLERAAADEAEVLDIILVVLAPTELSIMKQANAILELAGRCSRHLIVICGQATLANLELPLSAIVLDPRNINKLPDVLKNPPSNERFEQVSSVSAQKSGEGQVHSLFAPLLNRISKLNPRRKLANVPSERTRFLHQTMAQRPLSIAVQGLAGGVGGTTLAVNIAHELAALEPSDVVCLLDFDVQHGNVATYLNIDETSRIINAYQNIDVLDYQGFKECITAYSANLNVLPSPAQMLPVDALGFGGAVRLIDMAKKLAPIIIIDMPTIVSDWSGDIYKNVDMVICVANRQIRCVRNANKLRSLLGENNIPSLTFCYILNKVPNVLPADWPDLMAPFLIGLDAELAYCFADGGAEVSDACDLGSPLARHTPGNPLRKSILTLCKSAQHGRRMHVQEL